MHRPQSNIYRKIYKDYHGKIPIGHHIHHIDGDPWNNHISNLQCVTPEEHYLIHKRQGDKWAAGVLRGLLKNPNWDGNHYPCYMDSKLRRMNHGLIRIPEKAWLNGVRPPEIIFVGNMDILDYIITMKKNK